MHTLKMLCLFGIMPSVILLVVSFFVWFAANKAEAKGLRAFGYVITAILWFFIMLHITVGAYEIFLGKCSMKDKKHCPMMKGMKYCPMMNDGMSETAPQK